MKNLICLFLAAMMVCSLLTGCDLDAWFAQDITPDAGTSEPSTQPVDTDPTSFDDSQPTTAPTQFTEDPTDPSEIPSDPTQAPTEPSETPTDPVITPTEPTPTEPAPTEPVPTTPTPTEPAPTEPAPTVHTHSYTKAVTAPTCTAGGYTTHTCATCGHSYTDNKTAATGHSWGSWTVTQEPTYSSTGKEERSCANCGKTQPQSIPQLEMTATQMQQEVFRLVNIEREKEGLAPLEYVYALQEAADIRASEICESFSHTRPDGSSCFTVLDGYDVSYFSAGENIAAGYRSAAAVVEGWMNSDGHRANILSPNFTGLVVGVEDYHWVQLFIGG